MPTITFDQTFEAAVGISATVMVLSAMWIVRVLIQIEKSKVVALSSVLEDDGTGSSDLQFEESTSGGKQLEVETANGSPSGGAIEMSPTGASRKKKEGSPTSSPTATAKPVTAKRARRKLRHISWSFIQMQILSVSALVLLTYLLLVQSNANIFLRMLGSCAVFGMFLRFQIGEEIRRQRVDRIMLLLSLFLLIASMLSTLVYSMKTLKQGEIYEGPARIVGYSQEQYNNTKHDPTTRTDIAVSWGENWGCPLSGGKVCQANVEGAMCQSHPDKNQTKHQPNYGNRRLEDNSDENDEKDEDTEEVEGALEEDLEDEEKSNQDLEEENSDLASENELLEEEIAELKEENEDEDEENDELVEQENAEVNEMADEYNEDIMIVEEEEYEDEQSYVDAEYEEDEENLEDKIEAATDDETEEELEDELSEDEEDLDYVDEEFEEDEELLEDYEDEYADLADEDYDEFADAQDNTIAFDEEKEEAEEEVEETEDEIEEKHFTYKGGSNEKTEEEEEEEEIEEVFEEEEYEEEMEEEYGYADDEWYWDEYPDYYDDDSFEDDYWDYDWDSVWGDYACEDLFESDIGGQTYDPTTPAGGDDEWPFVNIYGSCKTCEAYILDYFAEEVFEETQEFKQQAVVYLAGAMAGFLWALLSYIQYKVSPTSESELELLGSDGGVMA